ncbi:MAG: acyl CoA:acetate/3-ketoacid CoA transferase [Ignavibacteriae bacterium HGW-Ignavibacteriae-4]|jgi:propionate CoA-transferase|nr:MAG: acyl CoA:acetate/3-ketoacid CoA transferase [Ignavibacteriae bacterium HGW-Ignavibacteriae-4]
MSNKVISSQQAAELIKDEDTLGVNGFVGFGHPEELSVAIEERFLATGHPANLTLVYGAGQGDGKSPFGLNHFGHEGLTKKVICGHVGLAPKLAALISNNIIEGYNFPQGVVTHLFRAIAGNKVGVITHVGLKTFADPRIEGAKMNSKTKEDAVELINVAGKELLLYKHLPINVALIRGTTADEFGNITMEEEAVFLETLSIAQAAKNSGGIVIAQVKRLAKRGSLNPQHVKIPGIMVDHIVIAKPENHMMSFTVDYNPAYSGQIKVPLDSLSMLELNERKIIARRSAFELIPGGVINLGIGVPDGVATVALEEGLGESISLSIESGAIGGVPGPGLNIGASTNPDALIDHPYQFDYYDGGGLDVTFLGLAEADQYGNINVSKFNNRAVGCGGFINISQNSKKVIFCGTFTAGSSNIEIHDGKLQINKEGKHKKFVQAVEQITFSGDYANDIGQDVLYITERAVFKLSKDGLMLVEIAPGIDLQRDILEQMEFTPTISPDLKLMDHRIFVDVPMGIRGEILSKDYK